MAETPRVVLSAYGEEVVVVAPVGDFDVDAADQLRSAFAKSIVGPRNRVVVDLSATAFLDSMALGTIIGGAKRATGAGGWLRLVAPTSYVGKVLKVTGLDVAFGVFATVDDAVAYDPNDAASNV